MRVRLRVRACAYARPRMPVGNGKRACVCAGVNVYRLHIYVYVFACVSVRASLYVRLCGSLPVSVVYGRFRQLLCRSVRGFGSQCLECAQSTPICN